MSKIVVTEDPTGRRFRRADNGDVVAYGDELADGTVVVKMRGREETRRFKPLFRIDLNWRVPRAGPASALARIAPAHGIRR